jgi:uncharacterized protein
MFRKLITFLFLQIGLSFVGFAAISLPTGADVAVTGEVEGPAKEALEAYRSGRILKAIELAKPLAENGNADALFLMGFAHENGRGVEASRELAISYYRKAAEGKHKDAVYRLSYILLASEKEEERDQARQELEKAVEDDPANAGRILGEAYLRGLLSEKPDPEKALVWWKRSASSGDLNALLIIARFYEGAFGFPDMKDIKQSLEYYQRAAELGDAGAMSAIGSRYLSGEESFRDEKKGREWLMKAIAEKEYSAYLALGDYEEFVKKDMKAALAEYERGKDAGQIDCILRTADFYMEGKGIDKDEERGRTLLIKAAEAGNPLAAFRVASVLLSNEKPTPTDVITGYAFLLSAANSNFARAQHELGLFYLSGKFGMADGPAGVAWFTRAAQAGDALAQFDLGQLYERGAGSAQQNLENAGQLYSLSATQGHAGATLALARLVRYGIGTKLDLPKAWALAALAEERGNEEAVVMKNEIQEEMGESGLDKAKEELKKLKEPKKDEESN